ncbi:molybdate ABC transporter substrate-binding protein [Arcobacter peruensis]|uniref:molybdate ABC transporter substrate-binding protein n=1 Tax=Arcobacter peruensis TaxID=2320140 RepID=UPI000F09A094|nr:molybdate ABC transporter substrate-binding protein [Arcobacter peruensis]
MNFRTLFLIVFISSSLYANVRNELLFYIGITMVKPVNILAKEFELSNNCKIKILQGGSQDLYDSIKSSQVGDLYLPGSLSYRNKYLKDGLLLDGKFVGYNKLSLVVKKGNPKNIKASLEELANENINVVLGNDQSSSVGKASKKILLKHKLYKKAIINAVYLASDSRNLIQAIKSSDTDLTLNWHATTYWKENKNEVEAIELDDKYTIKSKLVFNLLKTSKNKQLSKKFLEYVVSKRGKEVFKKYGFLNNDDLKNFDKVTF